MYLFQLGRSGAHFEAFCPFKASDDWKDSKVWKAVKTPRLPRNDGDTKSRKAAEVSSYRFGLFGDLPLFKYSHLSAWLLLVKTCHRLPRKQPSIVAVNFTTLEEAKRKEIPSFKETNKQTREDYFFLIISFLEALKKKPINEISALAINIKGGKCANKTCFWKSWIWPNIKNHFLTMRSISLQNNLPRSGCVAYRTAFEGILRTTSATGLSCAGLFHWWGTDSRKPDCFSCFCANFVLECGIGNLCSLHHSFLQDAGLPRIKLLYTAAWRQVFSIGFKQRRHHLLQIPLEDSVCLRFLAFTRYLYYLV